MRAAKSEWEQFNSIQLIIKENWVLKEKREGQPVNHPSGLFMFFSIFLLRQSSASDFVQLITHEKNNNVDD